MPARGWRPRRLVIIGPGLMGGSIAAAARAAWPSVEIIGIDRRAWPPRHCGPFTRVTGPTLPAAAPDLTIIATPEAAALRWLARLASAWGPEACITDVCSTKRALVDRAASLGLHGFVGGHPMAGGTGSGAASADGTLFAGRPWILVPGRHAQRHDTARRVRTLIRAAGASPVRLQDAAAHDRLMAVISHLPQVTSSLVMAVAGERAGRRGLRLSGPGLLDTTRLAASHPTLWTGILSANADAVSPLLRRLALRLTRLAEALDAGTRSRTHAALTSGRRWRTALVAARRHL